MVSEMLHQYSCLILNIPCAHSYTLHTSVFHKYSISNSFLGEINDTRLNGIAVVKKGKAKYYWSFTCSLMMRRNA